MSLRVKNMAVERTTKTFPWGKVSPQVTDEGRIRK